LQISLMIIEKNRRIRDLEPLKLFSCHNWSLISFIYLQRKSCAKRINILASLSMNSKVRSVIFGF